MFRGKISRVGWGYGAVHGVENFLTLGGVCKDTRADALLCAPGCACACSCRSSGIIRAVFSSVFRRVFLFYPELLKKPPARPWRGKFCSPLRCLGAYPGVRKGGRREPRPRMCSRSAAALRPDAAPQAVLRCKFTPFFVQKWWCFLLDVIIPHPSGGHTTIKAFSMFRFLKIYIASSPKGRVAL